MTNISPLAPAAGFPNLLPISGVRFAAVCAGVKYQNRDDVMLAEIAAGSSIAGVFTKSSTRSAAVLDCQDKLAQGTNGHAGVAFLVNSGNANAFTGKHGMNSVRALCTATADAIGVPSGNVFTSSTGVIGEPLPHDRIAAKLGALKTELAGNSIEDVARAIMTTDTFPKGAGRQVQIDGVSVSISGFAKGSGMIAPDMATMLVYIFTDAKIWQADLQSMVSSLNETSFNAITVDGDTSTSDTLLMAATGASGVDVATNRDFKDALNEVMLELAHLVIKDGEGATKFVQVTVKGAASTVSAKTIGLSIANSPLVKTAIAGEDPNWGRVVMGVGKSGEPADRDKLAIWFGDILVAEEGWVAEGYSETAGADYMKNQDLVITVDVGVGSDTATVWTCDLTHQYITINADYRS